MKTYLSAISIGPPDLGTDDTLRTYYQYTWKRDDTPPYGTSKYMPHQGEQECARRRRQMARLAAR